MEKRWYIAEVTRTVVADTKSIFSRIAVSRDRLPFACAWFEVAPENIDVTYRQIRRGRRISPKRLDLEIRLGTASVEALAGSPRNHKSCLRYGPSQPLNPGFSLARRRVQNGTGSATSPALPSRRFPGVDGHSSSWARWWCSSLFLFVRNA